MGMSVNYESVSVNQSDLSIYMYIYASIYIYRGLCLVRLVMSSNPAGGFIILTGDINNSYK